MPEQTQVMRQRLGETKTRIENDLARLDTGAGASVHALTQKGCDLCRHVIVMWIVLHVAGLAKHMHQAHRQAGRSRRIQCTIAPQRTNVVDQARTQPSRLAHDRRRRGIDRNNHIKFTMDRLDHRRNTLQLFKRGNHSRTGSGRLASHIDQRGTRCDHSLGMAQGGIQPTEAATVGKGVRCGIENAHNMGMGQIKNPVAARQPGWVLLGCHV